MLPGETLPLAGPPLLPVTVWVVLSLLVQVTVVPLVTVRDDGLNAKPWMLTDWLVAVVELVTVPVLALLVTAVFVLVVEAAVLVLVVL